MLENEKLVKVLSSKGVKLLYHANTVKTACTFLQEGSLLSRKYVEEKRLAQTSQSTDAKDKRYGVWNDIFLDGVDIHYRSRERNFYGPVLFELDTFTVFSDPAAKNGVRLTRENPANWTDNQFERDRYYANVGEVETDYSYGDFKSFTITMETGALALKPHLKRIVVDNPKLRVSGFDMFETAVEALQTAAQRAGLKFAIDPHKCREGCRCLDSYRKLGAACARFFRP